MILFIAVLNWFPDYKLVICQRHNQREWPEGRISLGWRINILGPASLDAPTSNFEVAADAAFYHNNTFLLINGCIYYVVGVERGVNGICLILGSFDSALPDFSLGWRVVPFLQWTRVCVSCLPLGEWNRLIVWQGWVVDGVLGAFILWFVL